MHLCSPSLRASERERGGAKTSPAVKKPFGPRPNSHLCVTLVPKRTGVEPIAFLTTHGPPITLGMSLNLALRSSEEGGGGASSIIPHLSPPKLLTGRLAYLRCRRKVDGRRGGATSWAENRTILARANHSRTSVKEYQYFLISHGVQ